MLGTYIKYVTITALITGLFLSFHEHLWPWAIIPASFVWIVIALGLTLERLERERN